MKRIQLTVLVVTLAALSGSSAFAAGAVAVGQPKDVAHNGVALGLSTQFKTTAAASQDALAQCRKTQVKASTRALCHVVKTFSGQCAAIALDPTPGTPGFGWAVAATKWQASSTATANCAAVAGPGRQWACKVVGADCD